MTPKRTLHVSIARPDIGIIHTVVLNLEAAGTDLTQRNVSSVMLADGTTLDLNIAYLVEPAKSPEAPA